MCFGGFDSRQKNLFFFGEKQRVFHTSSRDIPSITLKDNEPYIRETLFQRIERKKLEHRVNALEKDKALKEYFGIRSAESRIYDILDQNGIMTTPYTRALFLAALDAKYDEKQEGEGKGIEDFMVENKVGHQFFQRERTQKVENEQTGEIQNRPDVFRWQASVDYNIALEDELVLFTNALKKNGKNINAVLKDFFGEKELSAEQRTYIIEKAGLADAKMSNDNMKKLSAGLGSNIAELSQGNEQFTPENINAHYIQNAYIRLRKENNDFNINEKFKSYGSASAIPNNEAAAFLREIANVQTTGESAREEDKTSAKASSALLVYLAQELESEDAEKEKKAKAKFQLIFAQLSLWETGYSANRVKIWNEKNKESFTNHISRGIEGLMDMAKYGDTTEKAAAFAIMVTLGLGLFGKGPLEGLQTPLLAMGGAAALGISAESIYNVDLMGALEDAATGDDNTPYSYFIRKHFPAESLLDGRYKDMVLKMREIDMRDIIAWQNDSNRKGEHPEKAFKKHPAICNIVSKASGVSNMSDIEKAHVAQEIVDAAFYEVALHTDTAEVGMDQKTKAAKTSKRRRAINRGRKYAEDNLQNQTFGDVLDSFIGTDIIESKNPVAWLRSFVGGSLESMGDFFTKLQLNDEDEIQAFIKKGINHPQKLQATLAFGRELYNRGKEFTFNKATEVYNISIPGTNDVTLKWIWDNTLEKPVMTILGAGKNAVIGTVEIAKMFPGMPIWWVIETLDNATPENMSKFIQGTIDGFTLWINGIEENPLITENDDLKKGAPDSWFIEDAFGRYADEVVETLYPFTKLKAEKERYIQKNNELTAKRDSLIKKFNTTSNTTEQNNISEEINNITAIMQQNLNKQLDIQRKIREREKFPEGIYMEDNALFATALVPITMNEEKAQQTLKTQWTDTGMVEAAKEIIKFAKKDNIVIPGLLKEKSKDKENSELTIDDFKNLDDYFIHNAIIKKDDDKNYWMVALRVPTGTIEEQNMRGEKPVEEMKGFEQVFNEELEKFGKEKITLRKKYDAFYIDDVNQHIYGAAHALPLLDIVTGTGVGTTTSEIDGHSLPTPVAKTLLGAYSLDPNTNTKEITRNKILKTMKGVDDIAFYWLWFGEESGERIKEFTKQKNEQRDEKDSDYRATILKNPRILRDTLVDMFNTTLFDFEKK